MPDALEDHDRRREVGGKVGEVGRGANRDEDVAALQGCGLDPSPVLLGDVQLEPGKEPLWPHHG